MSKEKTKNWDLYHEYESLDKILTAQNPWSAEAGNPVHDETLFIIFHQIYELWFKQILFELDDIQARFESDTVVDDRDIQPILTYLGRIAQIFKQLVSMIDVLQTMPAQSFVDFRQYLKTASGFQSWQFRLIELRLGLRREDRIPVFEGEFDDELRKSSKEAIRKAESSPTLYEQIDEWLARTPFINQDDYSFWEEYRASVYNTLEEKARLLPMQDSELNRAKEKFDSLFDQQKHKKAQQEGLWRMSLPALQAALFINIYSHEPVLQGPNQLLRLLTDIDELLARWRYRHALMVQRMVGMSAGTGGSSGYGYLMETLERHRIYTDLFALSNYLIPSQALPDLPQQISKQMGYRYSGNSSE